MDSINKYLQRLDRLGNKYIALVPSKDGKSTLRTNLKKLLWCKKVNKQYLFLRQHTFLTNELVNILKEKIWVSFRKSYLKKVIFYNIICWCYMVSD